jgi:pyruvate,orthophosphate dikinase
LRIKGRATAEALASAVDADPKPYLATLLSEGLVEETRFGYRVTESGGRRADELYAAERMRAGAAIMDVYGSFGPINDDVKQIVTDWQLRPAGGSLVPNDHTDTGHDEQVIARLRSTDAKVPAAIAPLAAALPRFDVYTLRLRRAIEHVSAGDGSMVAAPTKDSYHTVWFELHEELLILADQPRAE